MTPVLFSEVIEADYPRGLYVHHFTFKYDGLTYDYIQSLGALNLDKAMIVNAAMLPTGPRLAYARFLIDVDLSKEQTH